MRKETAAAAPRLFFEDFTPGRVFELGVHELTEQEITAFAHAWDPQAMHLEAGPELIASGWQTVCVWMRLYVEAVLRHASMLPAPGVEELRWLAPVRPGMQLQGRVTILEAWPSKRSPGRGTMRLRGELLDDTGAQVMTMLARGHARTRETEEGNHAGHS